MTHGYSNFKLRNMFCFSNNLYKNVDFVHSSLQSLTFKYFLIFLSNAHFNTIISGISEKILRYVNPTSTS